MTTDEKLSTLKVLLGISDTEQDTLLSTYLTLAEKEIIGWKYSLTEIPDDPVVSESDEVAEIHACVAGYGLMGVENQTASVENGIHRTFKYEDMVAYIRSHVTVIARVM